MLFQNILVPYDDSKCALHAFEIAIDMAKKYNSNLVVITNIASSIHGTWFSDYRYGASILKKEKKGANEALSKLESIAKKRGVEIVTDVLESNSLVKKLVSFAKSKKIDLIVMGTHGRTGLDKLIVGSVASGVSQRVGCPVLLVR
ncbi:MAG: UspA domain-containing protein [Marine Group I thaumarchaeote]|nr:MAG: UspA domain-containing protein [Marine Group I thaumarchaeote]